MSERDCKWENINEKMWMRECENVWESVIEYESVSEYMKILRVGGCVSESIRECKWENMRECEKLWGRLHERLWKILWECKRMWERMKMNEMNEKYVSERFWECE